MSIRINKYICESGLCSRKMADVYVQQGQVLIDGKLARLGAKVKVNSSVTVAGRLIRPLTPEQTVIVALNKPVGVVTTALQTHRRNIVDLVKCGSRVVPVGRLDKDSQGLILLTNRCALVDKILQSDNQHEKEYVVTVNKPVSDDFIAGLCQGVPMLGVVTKACVAVKLSEFVFSITLVQGLNRQIRRMCKHFNYSVTRLERVRIMGMELEGLKPGQWRELDGQSKSILLATLGEKLPEQRVAQPSQGA